MRFVSVHVVHLHSSTDTVTAKKKSRLDFYMIDNPSIAVHAFARRKLTSLSVDEILLPMYVHSR